MEERKKIPIMRTENDDEAPIIHEREKKMVFSLSSSLFFIHSLLWNVWNVMWEEEEGKREEWNEIPAYTIRALLS